MNRLFMFRLNGFLVIVSLVALTGCARVVAVSEVKADGSFRRTLTYHGGDPEKSGEADVISENSLDNFVTVPTKASGFAVTREQVAKTGGVIVTATKLFPVGSTGRGDLGIKSGAKVASASKLLVENTVTVRQTAPGTLEYRETLHWNGDPKEAFGAEPSPELIATLKKALPPELASDTVSTRKAALALQTKLWQIMMGPGEPILPILLFHPDYAQFRLTAQLAGSIDAILTDIYADRLTPAQRTQVTQRLVADATKTALSKSDSQRDAQSPGASDKSKSPMPIPLLFRVQMPGKITATNGETGATPGEVVWPLYSSSPAGGDITLTATCTVEK